MLLIDGWYWHGSSIVFGFNCFITSSDQIWCDLMTWCEKSVKEMRVGVEDWYKL